MDSEKRDKLSKLVEELTTSGEPTLNDNKMKEVKKICRISDDYIEHFYHLIMTQLNQEHSEIRLSAFNMVADLFSRSHHFRVLLVANMQEFLDLTVETDTDLPLPPPKEVAQKLKRLAIQTVQSWHTKYGEAYKKLALGYHFLKQVKKVDFQDIEARTLAERRRQEERQRRLLTVYKEKLEKAKAEMDETCEDIEESLTEINSCMKLLLPDPDNFNMSNIMPGNGVSTSLESAGQVNLNTTEDVQPEPERMTRKNHSNDSESETEADSNEGSLLRNAGVMSRKYNLELWVPDVLSLKETEDNEAVVNTLRDLLRLISTKHLPAVQTWIQVFTKVGSEDQLLRKAVELKQSLQSAVEKYRTLDISHKDRQRKVMRADESDDDFEEVPENEGFEPQVLDDLRVKHGLQPLISSSGLATTRMPTKQLPTRHVSSDAPSTSHVKRKACEEEQDPTTAAATLRILKQRLTSTVSENAGASGSSETTKETAAGEETNVPVVPFGIDLYYWGKEQPTAGKIIKYSSQHQFWVPHETEEEVVNEELSAQMKSRYITFAGRFQPVHHKCKAPLPNGGLCERQDRFKCPFHGKIIPRDELGRPTNPEDAERLEKERRNLQEEQPDWRDPELMREIEAATGEDLGSSKTFGKGKKGSKGKGKNTKYPSLTDLKQSVNTSRSRLEKKIFNKSSMRRVTDVMNKMDKRKHEKFSNQFNYALN